jgi:hypothetical protein
MSESTIRSQVRYSEKIDPDPLPPLISVADVKAFFGVIDNVLDAPLTAASAIVSSVVRSYTGRVLTKGTYTETFRDVFEPKAERYLIETPVHDLTVPSGAALLNARTGRVLLLAGPLSSLEYEGGYDPLPADLGAVCMELVRQQMAFMGYDQIGSAGQVNAPPEKAVWIGTLKVEYAVHASSQRAKSAGVGAISADGLAPYAVILDLYRSPRAMVAT